MFMHNGGIAGFYRYKAKFLTAINENILCEIKVYKLTRKRKEGRKLINFIIIVGYNRYRALFWVSFIKIFSFYYLF